MSKSLWVLAAGAALGLSLPAYAADDAAAQALIKENNCGKCHAVDKDKKGPSYKKVAAKYKGKADAEARLTDFVTKSPKVKLDDGTEEDHPIIKTKDMAAIKNLANWWLGH